MWSCRLTLWLVFLLSPLAAAQTGPGLLLKDFRREDQFELDTAWFVGLPSNTSGRGEDGETFDLRFDQLRLDSRLRLSPGQSDEGLAQAQPRAGFSLRTIQFTTDDPIFPRRMSDASVAVGMGIFKIDDWIGGVTAGVGYASAASQFNRPDQLPDNIAPFLANDANAFYGQANFAVGKTFENGDSFGLVVSYDGNRTIYPDVPLPGFEYARKVNDDFTFAIGFPFSRLNWDPDGPLSVDINLSVPQDLTGRVSLDFATAFGSPVEIYGAISRRTIASTWDELPRNRRVFFTQSLAEIGFSIEPEADEVQFLIAGGWDFERRLTSGFDTRQTTLLSDVDAGPFIRFAFELKL